MQLIDLGDGRWQFECTYDEREFARDCGFRWDREERMWVTSDSQAVALAEQLLSTGRLEIAPTLEQHGDEWVYTSLPSDRHVAKAAGFKFDPTTKTWRSRSPIAALQVAKTLSENFKANGDADRAEQYHALASTIDSQREAAVIASKANDAVIDIPAPEGMEYLPFQRAGIAYALAHPRCMIGDEMGLGKTIQAIGVINAATDVRRVLIVAPLAVTVNWQNEFARWSVRDLSVGRASAQSWPDTDVVIAHPQVLARHEEELADGEWDLVVVDESHFFKNPKAQRTRALVDNVKAKRALALTGTPIPNRPIELWPIAHWLAPDVFSDWRRFVMRYCKGTYTRYGLDYSGASNLDELRDLLRSSILVRRQKADVLTELPTKRRQIVVIGSDVSAEIERALAAERTAITTAEIRIAEARAAVELAKAEENEAAYQQAVTHLRDLVNVEFTAMSRARHELAVAKAPVVGEYAADALESGVDKIVIWAHHHDVVDILFEKLRQYRPVVITGETSADQRAQVVEQFQTGDSRVFIGSITAAGVGITLTAASHAMFAELDWVPGNLTQAEDRCHRIGQTDSVLIQHLVVDGSLDARMAQTLVAKQAIADKALDRGEEPEYRELGVQVGTGVLVVDEASTKHVERDELAVVADRIDDAMRELIHEGVRILAHYDYDGASLRNEQGFSKVDVVLGHALAEADTLTNRQAALAAHLIRKYRRQLPSDMVERVTSLLSGDDPEARPKGKLKHMKSAPAAKG